jgi:hypothetical protein
VPACLAVLGSGPATGAGSAPVAEGALIAAPAHGRAAVDALGNDLDVAASRTGLSTGRLRELLTNDSSAWVDRSGRLFYVDREHTDGDEGAAPATEAAAFPYADSFRLHSRPNATRKVYLDFDGHQVSGSAWNDASHPVIDVAAYTQDGSAAFSDAELDVVQEVWARVAEDYAPFNLDVTTEDPGSDGLVRSSSEDAGYGMRTSVTTDVAMRDIVCGGECAGVAYVGVFDYVRPDQYYQPAFALPRPTYTAAQVAEIVSHEIGHTLGLSHDGLGSATYYQDATGTKIWSPVMGAGYTPLTQFSNGDYAGATQTQDDFAVIAQNGPTQLTDDYGDSRATAYTLGAGEVTSSGLVTSRTDLDVFAVTRSCAGTLSATLAPVALGPDLDTRLRLVDASGAELAASAPATARGGTGSPVLTGMGAALSQSVGPGTYYLEVDGTGLADPTYGYSDYGSVGRYTLSVTGCPGSVHTATAPSAPVIVALERDGAAHGLSLVWDDPGNDGGAAVSSYVVTAGGQSVTVPATTHAYTFGALAPSTTYTLGVAAVNSVGTGPAATRTATTGWFSGTPSPSPSSPTSGPTTTGTPAPTGTPTTTGTPTGTPTVTPTPTPTPTGTTSSTPGVTAAPTTSGAPTSTATPTTSYAVPAAPRGVLVKRGKAGGPMTVRVSWQPPASNGNAPLTGYDVVVWKAGADDKMRRHRTFLVPAESRHLTLRLAAGRYRFAVAAENFVGTGPRSARTPYVRPR